LVIGRAKNSARHQFSFTPWAIRAGFEPFDACGNSSGSKSARFNPARNEYHWRAEFFALPVRFLVPSSFRLKQKKARG